MINNAEDIYEKIIRNVDDGIIFIDLSGNILFFNKKMHEMLGLTESEIAGKNIFDMVREDHATEFRKFIENSS